MDKLLSEEELHKKVYELLGEDFNSLYADSEVRDDIDAFNKISAIGDVLDLIQSQKQAWADMVIGEDIECDRTCSDGVHDGQKRLITEQRERNKL